MDDLLGPQQSPKQAATLKEMQRKANDRIRVANPTDEDFVVRWDGLGFTIPARGKDIGQGKGQAVLPRYVAQNYIKHMTDKLNGEKRLQAVEQENQRRVNAGMKEMEIDGKEREPFEHKAALRLKEELPDLVRTLWLGIEEEYGFEDEASMGKAAVDERSPVERILEDMERPAQPLPEEPDTQDLEQLGTFQLQKIAKEKGISTQRTDKKDELIAKISQ